MSNKKNTIHTNVFISAIADAGLSSLFIKINFLPGGGAENRRAKINTGKTIGNKDTPAIIGPKGIIQNIPKIPAINIMIKNMTNGVIEPPL